MTYVITEKAVHQDQSCNGGVPVDTLYGAAISS